MPNVVLTVAISWIMPLYVPEIIGQIDLGGGQLWSSYNIAIGLLLVFRTQQAYSRWWEGGSLLQQVRGEWYNAASSLIAFSSSDPSRIRDVQTFQHLLVRLVSLLYCSALQQVAMMDDEMFEIIDNSGIDAEKLKYLRSCHNRCEVLIQWIQRLIVRNMEAGVITVPAPIVSRVFHELSRGIVHLNDVRKVKEFPFPFPYAQMVTFMLTIHWLLTPLINCMLVENTVYSAILSFVSVFAFWSINYIAVEIEMPFGADANDLPIVTMQKDMNKSLMVLLDRRIQEPPSFDMSKSFHVTKHHKKACFLQEMGYERRLSASWRANSSNRDQTPIVETERTVPSAESFLKAVRRLKTKLSAKDANPRPSGSEHEISLWSPESERTDLPRDSNSSFVSRGTAGFASRDSNYPADDFRSRSPRDAEPDDDLQWRSHASSSADDDDDPPPRSRAAPSVIRISAKDDAMPTIMEAGVSEHTRETMRV